MNSISLGEGRAHALAIGVFASICRDRLGDELIAFAEVCPDVDLGMHEMSHAALLPALARGDLAVAVLPGNLLTGADPAFPSLHLWTDQVVVAMAKDHPLAAHASIAPAQLADEVFLVSRQQWGGDMHRFLAHRALPTGQAVNSEILNLGQPRIVERVALGDGVTLICASHADVVGEGIVIRPVEGANASFPVFAYWRDAQPQWPLTALLDILATSADADAPVG